MKIIHWVSIVTPLFGTACGVGPAAPLDLPTLSIRVEVSGGFAGADLAYAVEPDGVILAVRCASLCDFEAGDTLLRLTPAQHAMLGTAIESAGVEDVVGVRDFGTQCCDQFSYVLVFTDVGSERTLRGSSEVLPEEVGELVRLLEGYRQELAPVVVEMEGDLDAWHRDPVELADVALDGPNLRVTARYGGGCTRHDLDLVAWSGWMESFPVQVGVALAHDAHGDACRALLTRELVFDLSPLREAYADAYGSGPATLVMKVRPAAAGSAADRLVSWTF